MNKAKPLSWVKHPLALSVAASSALMLLPSANAQAAEACVDGTWQDAPNNIWSPDQQAYPVRAESEHFQIRFLDAEASISQAQAEAALNAFESMYDWFLSDEVSFPEPFCDSSTKYKIQVFANRNWGLTGSGTGDVPAMWVSDGAIQVASEGHIGGLVHEFTHTMQFASGGLRNGGLPGWMWENHAEFMTHSFPEFENKTGCSEIGAWQPHMPFGGSRLRYCNWMFWDYVRMQPDLGMAAVSRLWPHTRNQDDQDPIVAFKEANGLTQSDFQDLYGEFAMTNVNWDYDYYDADNTTRGEKYRSYYGTTDSYDNSAHWWRSSIFLRRARMEAMDLERRRFAVSPYYAPEIYGYNHVLLIPDAGATSIVLDFQGMVQDAPAPDAQTGVLALEPGGPGAGGAYSLAQDPASAWRWGIVAVTTDGRSRYTEMKAGQSGTLEYPLQGDERYITLAVAATPDVHHGLFWEQLHHTRYRYPYMIQVDGAMPEGFEAGYNPAARFHQFGGGRFHANGGGWVANAATVDDSVYIGPNAAVVGGTVTGNARIEDYAVVWSGNVSGNAVIKGLTQLTREMNVTDNAEIAVTVADGHTFETGTAYLGGSSKFYGDLILTGDFVSHGSVTQGAYTGLIFPELTNNPVHGSDMQDMPVEVTARFDPVWHEMIRDTDGDGVADESDAFPYDPAEHADSDGDGIGDNSDPFPESAHPWLNLAPQATLSTSHVSPWEILEAVADEIQPGNSADKTGGAYGNWNGEENYGATNWVNFAFDQAKRVALVDVYWWQDGAGITLPSTTSVQYWDGFSWRDLGSLGAVADRFNRLSFDSVVTSEIRISMASASATGILEARIWGEELSDADGDGVIDELDAFPYDASETQDSDGDGVGNNADAFPSDASETQDSDGDGVGNNADAFPNDASETVDSDGDGVGNNADAFPNDANETQDSDGDGVGNNADPFPESAIHARNLALNASLATSHVSPWENLEAIRDGLTPADSADNSAGAYGNWDGENNYGAVHWVSFAFDQVKRVSHVDVYWWADGVGIALPTTATVKYLNNGVWEDLGAIGVSADTFNRLSFNGVLASEIRISMASARATGILEARVWGEDLPDTDGDGVIDELDTFPLDASESQDSDGDGVGNNADAFPNDATESLDSDGDGVGNNADAFPNDATETEDSDGDGVGNNADVFPNDATETQDSDGDGVGNNADAFPNDATETEDSDGDGVGNNADAFPNDATETQDSDGDGVGNNADAFPNDATETVDSDGDGVGNNSDAFPNDATETEDSDGDGVGNNADAFPNDATETQDSDGDGVGNNADAFPNDAAETEDSDGDGVGNNADAFPNDATETADSDGDGVGNNADAFPNDASETLDSDGDGVGNNADAFPFDPTESLDSDGDGLGNNADAFPADPTESVDSDGDGVGNNADAFPNDATETTDTDGDGIGDNSDPYPESAIHGLNLATEATLATSHVSPWETLEAIRDGKQPASSADNSQGAYGNWDGEANYGRTDWVSFTWPVKKSVTSVEVYWWHDGAGIAVPDTAVIEYLTEQGWVSLGNIGRELDQFNRASFDAVNTTAVRVAMASSKATGILEMRIEGEALPDRDADGVPDIDDAFPDNSAETADRDGDGVGDNADAFPDDASEQLDSDNDGLGDNSDPYPQAGFDPVNIASSATVETSHVSPWETLAAVNDGAQPTSSSDNSNGAYGNWDGEQNYGNTNWVSLNFAESRNIAELRVYWWNDGQGIATPTTAEAEYWDGNQWVSLGNVGTELNTFNSIRFAAISTTAVRISMASDRATGILEVQVLGESNGNEVSAQSFGAERQLVDNAAASSSSSSSGGATGIGLIGFLMGILALVRRRPRK